MRSFIVFTVTAWILDSRRSDDAPVTHDMASESRRSYIDRSYAPSVVSRSCFPGPILYWRRMNRKKLRNEGRKKARWLARGIDPVATHCRARTMRLIKLHEPTSTVHEDDVRSASIVVVRLQFITTHGDIDNAFQGLFYASIMLFDSEPSSLIATGAKVNKIEGRIISIGSKRAIRERRTEWSLYTTLVFEEIMPRSCAPRDPR